MVHGSIAQAPPSKRFVLSPIRNCLDIDNNNKANDKDRFGPRVVLKPKIIQSNRRRRRQTQRQTQRKNTKTKINYIKKDKRQGQVEGKGRGQAQRNVCLVGTSTQQHAAPLHHPFGVRVRVGSGLGQLGLMLVSVLV
jgi:hypothetical protein